MSDFRYVSVQMKKLYWGVIGVLACLLPVFCVAGTYQDMMNQPEPVYRNSGPADPDSAFASVFAEPLQTFTQGIARAYQDGMNPLVTAQNVGQLALNMATRSFELLKGEQIMVNSVTVSVVRPFLMACVGLLFSAGLSLGIFLPLVPAIYWLCNAITWAVSVMVCVTGATLFAAQTLLPEDMPLRRLNVRYGIVALADAIFRPILSVLAFSLSTAALLGTSVLFNMLLSFIVGQLPSSTLSGAMTLACLLMLYARMNLSIVCQVFSLIVTLPDAVLMHLGGRLKSMRVS